MRLSHFLLAFLFLGSIAGRLLAEDTGVNVIPYPHGQRGPLILSGTHLLMGNSWSRDNGVLEFDLSSEGAIRYSGGVPASGYIMDAAVNGDSAFFTTTFSLHIVAVPTDSDKRVSLRRNLMLDFPGGGVQKVRAAGEFLLLACRDGLRIYHIKVPSEPNLISFQPDLTDLDLIVPGNSDFLYTTRKEPSKILICSLSEDGLLAFGEKPFLIADGPVGQLVRANGGIFYQNRKSGRVAFVPVGAEKPQWESPFPVSSIIQGNGGLFFVESSPLQLHFLPARTDGAKIAETVLPVSKLPADTTLSNAVFSEKHFAYLDHKKGTINVIKLQKGVLHGNPVSMPIVFSEGNFAVSDHALYGMDVQGGNQRLYGFSLNKKRKDSAFDFYFPLPKQKDSFTAYNVMPAAGILLLNKQYLLANGILLDLSKPLEPVIVKNLEVSANQIHQDADTKRLFFAANHRIVIEDISALPQTTRLGEFTPKNKARYLQIQPKDTQIAYALNGTRSIEVLKIDQPANVSLIQTVKLPFDAWGFALHRNRLYVADCRIGPDNQGLLILNTENPSLPVMAKEIKSFSSQGVQSIRVVDGKLYVSDGNRIRSFQIKGDELSPDREYSVPDRSNSYPYMEVKNGCVYGKSYGNIAIWKEKK